MKNWKILIPSILATSTIPMVSMVACNNQNPTVDTDADITITTNQFGKVVGQSILKIEKGKRFGDIKPELAELVAPIDADKYEFDQWVDPFDQKIDENTVIDDTFPVKALFKKIPEPTPEGFEFGYNTESHTATVTKCTAGGDVVIPSEVEHEGEIYSVTSIGKEAFRSNRSVITVNVPYTITSIGVDAFSSCANLSSINIPDSVEAIENYAFADCSNLRSFVFPSRIGIINGDLFLNCTKLSSVFIPNSVTNIKTSAFAGCNNLTFINLPNSIVSIGDHAFSTSGLTSITIPQSVKTINTMAFMSCNITNTSSGGGCGFSYSGTKRQFKQINKNECWPTSATLIQCSDGQCPLDAVPTPITDFAFDNYDEEKLTATLTDFTGSDTDVDVPEHIKYNDKTYTVTAIGQDAFEDNTNVLSFSIPNTIETIGDGAFSNCDNLETIFIPDSVVTIEANAFYSCNNLSYVILPNSLNSIGDNAFRNCKISDTSGPAGVYGFNYNGETSQWKKISKGENWHSGNDATWIRCLHTISPIDS